MLIIIGPSTVWDRWVLGSLDGMGLLKTFSRNVITFLIFVSVFIFNPFFFHFYCPTRSTVLTFSQSLPMLPYVILEISPCFPIEWTLTSFSFSLPSRQFTRYQEQDLLVAIFGLLRTILTISTISLPPPDLPYDLSRGSLQAREYLWRWQTPSCHIWTQGPIGDSITGTILPGLLIVPDVGFRV